MKINPPKLLQQKRISITAQIATILIILTIPIFVFIAQQQTETKQQAAIQTVQTGVNACGNCSKYIDGNSCSPATDTTNGRPYCIESNYTCNGSTPTFIVHKCEANSSSSSSSNTGTYRTYPQAGWTGENCFPTNPCSSSGTSSSSSSSDNSSSSSTAVNKYPSIYL